MFIIATIITLLLLCVIGLLVWLINTINTNASSQREQYASQGTSFDFFNKQLKEIKESEEKLIDNTQKSLNSNQQNINKNLTANQELIEKITKELTNVLNTNQKIVDMSADLRRLQDILQSPKLRGQLGEWSLENLLTQILPRESFELQKKMADGQIADALITLNQYSVAIDAKFPLPNFEKMLQTENESEKDKFKKMLIKDIKKHIDKIAKDYIRPTENTLDFAIMYIPAENIYYETVASSSALQDSLLSYAMEKKIIPVSPNLLYAYLMTIVMGLHGLQIEKKAAEIQKNLSKLSAFFNDFLSQWKILGSHIKNVYNKYDDSAKKLDRFEFHLQQIKAQDKDQE